MLKQLSDRDVVTASKTGRTMLTFGSYKQARLGMRLVAIAQMTLGSAAGLLFVVGVPYTLWFTGKQPSIQLIAFCLVLWIIGLILSYVWLATLAQIISYELSRLKQR